ncbi:MAG: Trm112 family protein [Edaphobacter sp.]
MSAKLAREEDLRWVVCPVCHKALRLEVGVVVCRGCGRRYPVVDGIPVLLADRASQAQSG